MPTSGNVSITIMNNIFIIMPCSGAPRTCSCDWSILPLDNSLTAYINFKLKTSFQDICSKIMFLWMFYYDGSI